MSGGWAASAGTLFELIRTSKPGLTRADLLALTGMSRSTLYSRLDALMAQGLTYESGQQNSTGGRPPTVIRFDDRNRVVLGFDIGHHSGRVAVLTGEGEVLADSHQARHSVDQVMADIDLLADEGERLLAGLPGHRLSGVGASIPAPVDTRSGMRWPSVAVPDGSYPLLDRLTERFGVLVCMENDARALALGAVEDLDEPMQDDDVLLGIKVGTGLGAGIVTGRQIMRGAAGSAGDIGHMAISKDGPLCTCGSRGCLAAYVSGRAMLAELSRPDLVTVEDLERAARTGDAEVTALFDAGVETLGRHLAALMYAVNPSHVCIGGVLGRSPALYPRLVEAMRHATVPRIHAGVDFRPASPRIALRGMAALVVARAFSPERIDALLPAAQRS